MLPVVALVNRVKGVQEIDPVPVEKNVKPFLPLMDTDEI